MIMIKLLVGVKGTGKTKALISAVNEALETSKGYVVCIEKGATLRHEISYKVRLVNTDDYLMSRSRSPPSRSTAVSSVRSAFLRWARALPNRC